MTASHSSRLDPLPPLIDDDDLYGESSVRRIPQPVFDVAVGTLSRDGDPAPVYATPYLLVHGVRVRYMRDFYLGTLFVTGIIEAEGWRDEMIAEGVCPIIVEKCAEYVAERAL